LMGFLCTDLTRACPLSFNMGNCQQSRLLHHSLNDCYYSLRKEERWSWWALLVFTVFGIISLLPAII
jgi:hypothetical protein